jgi:hypothetical protein
MLGRRRAVTLVERTGLSGKGDVVMVCAGSIQDVD